MKKKVMALFLTAVLAVGMIACGGSAASSTAEKEEAPKEEASKEEAPKEEASKEEAPKEEASKEETPAGEQKAYKIAYFVKDGSMPFWRYVIIGAQGEAEKQGCTVTEFAPDSITNAAMQINQIEDAINSGFDALCVIAIDGEAALPALQKAHDAGIPVVLANGRIDAFEDQVAFVGVDNIEASKIVTTALYEELQKQDKHNVVAITNPPAAWVTSQRIQPVQDLAEQYGINLVTIQSGEGSRETAMSVMENLLESGEEIDAVWCMNDAMAMGVYQAILNAGKEDEIMISGFDGTPEGILAVDEGKIFVTIDQGPFDQGSKAVAAAIATLNGETVDKVIPTGGTLITKDNARAFYDEYYADLAG